MTICRHRFARILVVPVLLVLSGIHLPAHAGSFVILEESFESPVAGTQPGWAEEHSYSSVRDVSGGLFTTPYGSKAQGIWSLSGVKTTNITDRLQPGVTYTLTFNAGNVNTDTGEPSPLNQYTAQILAGTNVIASASAQTDTDDLSEQGTVTITTDENHPHLGQVLGVRFAHSGGPYQAATLIDNVKLVAEESAEWARTLFLGR